jgi:hypothetical protein
MDDLIADLTCDCRNRVGRKKTKNELMVVFQCDNTEASEKFDREFFLRMIGSFDAVCMILFLIVINRMNAINNINIHEHSMEFSDFSLHLKNVNIEKYSQEEQIL